MSVPSRAPVRRRLLVVVASAAALVGGLVLAPSAEAAKPPGVAVITAVTVTDGATIPTGGAKSPTVLVVAGTPFSVTVTFDRPPSLVKDTTVTIYRDSVPSTGGALTSLGTANVPAGTATGTAFGLLLPVTNRAVARAVVTDGSKDALAVQPANSIAFDVVDPANLGAPQSAAGHVSLFPGGGTAGGAAACDVTETAPYCADVYFPAGSGGDVRLAFTGCDTFLGCGTDPASGRQVLQVIFNTASVSSTAPVTVVYRCDKTKCGNIGVPQVNMLVGTGDLTQPLSSLDLCRKQGVQTSPSGYCFDAKQSTKDNAGDVYLYVLLTQDPRLSWP